jgi:hypothetical protein
VSAVPLPCICHWRWKKHSIGVGSTVTLHLSLALEDGTVAEETFGGEPHTFRMGDGSLVHGLELGLYGLKPGDTQRLKLYPEQAWGLRDPEKIHRLPRERFATDMQLEPGLIIGFGDIPLPLSWRLLRWCRRTRWMNKYTTEYITYNYR